MGAFKSSLLFLVFVAVAAVASTGLSVHLSDLHFGSYKITGIHPKSLRSVDGSASVTCTNSGRTFTMSNIFGTVYKNGRAFVRGYAQPVSVPVGSSSVNISGNATLCEDITLWDVLACIAFRAEDYTVDVSMTITTDGGKSSFDYSRQGMSVADILHNIRNR